MGCISSKEDINENNPHKYQVVNIDSVGNTICVGEMAINRAELTLRCANREPMHWPLNGLRRYGCDTNLFSFEAGRHCQGAEGLYAFRCRRAEQLFLTLQMYIQNPTRSVYSEPYMRQHGPVTGPAMPIGRQSTAAGTITMIGGLSIAGGAQQQQQPLIDGGQQQFGDQQGMLPPQQRHLLLANSPNRGNSAVTVAALQSMAQTRNLRLSSVSSGAGAPLSPDVAGGGGGALSSITFGDLGPVANSNLYQECTGRGAHAMDAAAESNNNMILHKKLSLDIPPAEPAPSPSNQQPTTSTSINAGLSSYRGICNTVGGPLSPATSFYHNEFLPAAAANYANAATVAATAASSSPPPTCSAIDYGANDRAYMNITIGEQKALLARQVQAGPPETPRVLPVMTPGPQSAGHAPMWPQTYACGVATSTATATAATTPQHPNDALRLYENLDLPVRRRPSSSCTTTQAVTAATAASAAGCAPAPGAKSTTTPTTPLFMTPEQLLSEPSSPSMLYIVLDLDQPSAATGSTTDAATTAEHGATSTTSCSGTAAASGASTVCGGGDRLPAMPRTPSITAGVAALLVPESPKYGVMDYAKIDFNKTMALSNSTTPSTELDSEESRRTRHSSVAKAPGVGDP